MKTVASNKIVDKVDGIDKVEGLVTLPATPRIRDFTKPSLKRIASIVTSCCVVMYTSGAAALGVGAATIDSFIGERLSLSIPLFNVDNNDALAVKLLSSSLVSQEDSQLKARIERANNQLAIVVSTEWLVNEPYLSFEIQVNDQSNSLNKEFTILLNLAPDSSLAASSNSNAGAESNRSTLLNSSQVRVENLSGGSGVLGPYDWAEAGNIPAKFGAVIDGQSLWRVARRINKALGVSVDQMMVALYEKNPDAFSSSSINSLQAGSFLDIPSYAAATKLTEVQAQARVLELSGSAVSAQPRETQAALSAPSPVAPEQSVDVDSAAPDDSIEPSAEDSISQQSFQMTGISEAGRSTASGEEAVEESQEIISSLAATVGNLTQELIRKDKKIQFLEDRVEVLESISDTTPASQAASTVTDDSRSLPDNPVESINSVSTSTAQAPSSSWLSGVSFWWWLLGLVVAISVLFRNRLASLFSDLNLFGSDDGLDFKEPRSNTLNENDYSVLSAIQKAKGDNELDGVSFHEIEENSFAEEERELLSIEKAAAAQGLPVDDLSVEEYLTVAMEDDDLPLGASVSEDDIINDDDFTVHDLDYFSDDEDDEDEEGGVGKPEVDAVEFETYETSDLADADSSFDQRIEKLLEDKDYAFARELLDFARHNEIDNERYHFERLRLYLAMDDEDGFYDYYQTIEAQIVEFDDQLQNSIAKLVTTLG